MNISVSFLFRAASRFSRITLKAILPTFSRSFWSENRNKPHVSKKSSSQAKNLSTQTAQTALWAPSFLIIHCIILAFNCRNGNWDFLSLTSFFGSRSDNCLALSFRHLAPLPTFAQPNQAKFFTHSFNDSPEEMHTHDEPETFAEPNQAKFFTHSSHDGWMHTHD